MRRRSPILRWYARILIACALVVLFLFCGIHIGQSVARYNAERLLADIRAIETKRSTWEDAQKLMTRWGAWGSYQGSCTAKACEYQISIDDWVNTILLKLCRSGRICGLVSPVAARVTELAHGHAPSFGTTITVQDGLIVSTRTQEEVWVPGAWFNRAQSPGYELLATSSLIPHLEQQTWRWPLTDRHPDYQISRSGGCMGCIRVRFFFTPAISLASLDRLADFNLSCFTRWSPCIDRKDILPTAAKEMEEEGADTETNYQKLTDCSYSTEMLARASENVFLLKLLTLKDEQSQTFAVRELERLKADSAFPPAPLQTFTIPPEAPYRGAVVHSGGNIIALFPNDDTFPHVCGVIPATPEALAAVRLALRE